MGGGASPGAGRASFATWLGYVVLTGAVALGLGLRLWLLFHQSINSDTAAVGLTARSILHGHFTAFFPGQVYGGVEAYLVAVLIAVLGQHAYVLALTSALLSAAAAILVWRIAARLVYDPLIAALAGALVWVFPYSSILNSTIERGFRGVVMVCGLGGVLLALRILDRVAPKRDWVFLGLVFGVGWWASPEITYFMVPGALIVVGALARERWNSGVPRVASALIAAVVGSLPWLWANIGSGFASLQSSHFPGAHVHTTFTSRLHTFVDRALPMQLDLLRPFSGAPILGEPWERLLHGALFALLAAALLLTLLQGGRALAIGAGLVVFPFLYALQPGTWYWNDGRYAVYLAPFVALVLALGFDRAVSFVPHWFHQLPTIRVRAVLVAVAAVVACGGVLSVVDFSKDSTWSDPFAAAFTRGWTNPESPAETTIAQLEKTGAIDAYANYWVAYKLDYLSKGSLSITTLRPDPDLEADIESVVHRAMHPAWLFVPGPGFGLQYWEFGFTSAIEGPSSVREQAFLGYLSRSHIKYRLIRTELLDAVIPAQRVIPSTVLARLATT
jgi:hypothetical protein